MKGAEFIYSLYVQANPVPDPDLLPLARDEAVLLTPERSPDMITQEQVEKRQPKSPPRRKRLVPALAAAAVLMVAVVAAAILMNGDAAPVAAVDADPVVVFDGTTCSYDGPTVIEEGDVQFTLTNSADETFILSSFRMEEPALSQELAAAPVGTDYATAPDSPMPDGEDSFVWVPPGGSMVVVHTWEMTPGTYVLDCVIGEPTEHVWRVARVEVVAP